MIIVVIEWRYLWYPNLSSLVVTEQSAAVGHNPEVARRIFEPGAGVESGQRETLNAGG